MGLELTEEKLEQKEVLSEHVSLNLNVAFLSRSWEKFIFYSQNIFVS